MYIDYSQWDIYDYKVSSLSLDLKNPRLGYLGEVTTQVQAIRVLIEKEKVYELAKKISEEGYYVGEEPIICIENNKKIVLEGNRRIAALKLLQNPSKYLPSAKARNLQKNIIEHGIEVDRKIRCHIAPNRLLANPIIYERHRGDAVQKWRTGNQYAFVAKMYSDGLSIEDVCKVLNETRGNVLGPLRAYNLFIEGQDILRDNGVEINIDSFDITNLERFAMLPEVSEFLGIKFNNDDGDIHIGLPREEFTNRLLLVFNTILESDNFSRVYNKRDHMIELLDQLKESPTINLSITPSRSDFFSKSEKSKLNLEEEKAKTTSRKKRKHPMVANWIISPDLEINFDDQKLDIMFYEMKHLSVDKVYSFAFLLRAYLEQSLYLYLDKKNLLSECSKSSSETTKRNNRKKVQTAIDCIKKQKGAATIEEIDQCMEILRFNPSNMYSDVGLKAMLEYVVNNCIVDAFDSLTYKNIKDYSERIKAGLDLAIHNIHNLVDITHNRRAWGHLEPLLLFLSQGVHNE